MSTVQAEDPTKLQQEFAELFNPILQMVYGTAVRLTGDRTEAEDLVQDAALLAYRGLGSFQRGTNFKAWFFRILTNAFYSRHRRTRHEKANLSTEEVPALYLYTRTAEAGLQGPADDPASAILDRLDSDEVGEALDRLPEEYRVVATLYFIDDLSYQQIAETLEVPTGTVRSRLHRGRRLLQKSLWDIAVERGIVRRQPAGSGLEPSCH
jgi:RNA polymerase sigma-70 factor (ECF subfamily)